MEKFIPSTHIRKRKMEQDRNFNNWDCSRLLNILLLLLLPTILYSADWNVFRGNSDRNGYINEQAYQPGSISLTEKWKYTASSAFISSPVVNNGIVYIATVSGILYAFDAYTGSVKFNVSLPAKVLSTPAIDSNTVYVSCQDGYFYALNSSNGVIKWKYNTGGKDCSSTVVYNNRVYFGTGFPVKNIYCLDANNGTLVWQKSTNQYVYSSPIVKDGYVYVGSNDGRFYCIDAYTGEEKWYFQTQGGVYFSTPAVYNNIVYCIAGNDDRRVYALDISTKGLKSGWQLNNLAATIPVVVSSSTVSDGTVYVCSGDNPNNILYALNSTTGSIKWQRTIDIISNIGFSSSPVIANDVLYVCSVIGVDDNSDGIYDRYTDGKLYEIDIATGSIIIQKSLGGPVVSTPAISNGWVYVGTGLNSSGTLYAFQTSKICAISSPADNSTISGNVDIKGFVINSDMSEYKLEYKLSSTGNWTTLKISNSNVNGDVISTLNTSSLPEDNIQVRLSVTDNSSNARQSLALINLTLNNTYTTANINASAGGTVTSADGTQVIFEPGSLTEDDTLTINKPSSYPSGDTAFGYKATNIVREFTLTKQANSVFKKLVTIKLPYTDSGVSGMTKDNLRICFWDTSKNKWQILHSSRPLTSENRVLGKVSHFSLYRIFEYTPGVEELISKETTYSYPNPCLGDNVVFKCYLGDDADIIIDVFNIAGERIASFENTGIAGMSLETTWDVTNIASGVYIYKLAATSKRTGEKKHVIKKQAIVH